MAAIVAAVLTALAVTSSGPAWGQDTGDADEGPAAPEAEAMGPAGMMQMLMGAPSDDGDTAPLIWPRFSSGREFLHHDRSSRSRR